MKMEIVGEDSLSITERFNAIGIKTEKGQEILILLRDGDLEIGLRDLSVKNMPGQTSIYFNWYSITQDGQFQESNMGKPKGKIDE